MIEGAAHTVFTFVDNKLTAKENEENVTDAALAELYAHIQSLPESSKKRKLVKQFNKQNGQVNKFIIIIIKYITLCNVIGNPASSYSKFCAEEQDPWRFNQEAHVPQKTAEERQKVWIFAAESL